MSYHKLTADFIDNYEVIKMVQPLSNDRYVIQECVKTPEGKWAVKFSTNSAHHICQYDGIFRKCADCDLNNIEEEHVNCITMDMKQEMD